MVLEFGTTVDTAENVVAAPTKAHNGKSASPATVIGLDGTPMSLDDLPPPDTRRWVMRRKAAVVLAVRGGLIEFGEACDRYSLTAEELMSWDRAIDRHGVRGLRVTRLQDYRRQTEDDEETFGRP